MTTTLTTTARQRRLIALGSLTPGAENALPFTQASAEMCPSAGLAPPAASHPLEQANLFAA